MTQEELAFKAGGDRSSISLLEHDRKPPLGLLFRLCDALGVRASKPITPAEKRRGPPG
jgi:transcriptional regulator with XRE-family HTH domain